MSAPEEIKTPTLDEMIQAALDPEGGYDPDLGGIPKTYGWGSEGTRGTMNLFQRIRGSVAYYRWVVARPLFDELRDGTSDGNYADGAQVYKYPDRAAAVAALDEARGRLHEKIGRASGRKPYTDVRGRYLAYWVDPAEETLSRKQDAAAATLDAGLYRRLRGTAGSAFEVRKYTTESEAYRDLGRVMVDLGCVMVDLGRVMVEERSETKAGVPQPVTKEPTVANETKTEVKTEAEKPAYAPYPHTDNDVYWYTGNDVYGPANLPAPLFAKLAQAETKSGDWAYYPTRQLALADLVAAELALEAGVKKDDKKDDKAAPEEKPAAPKPVAYRSYGYSYFQTASCQKNGYVTGLRNIVTNVVPDDVLAAMIDAHPDRAGCTSRLNGWVAYRKDEDAAAAYDKAVETLVANKTEAPAEKPAELPTGKIHVTGQTVKSRSRSPLAPSGATGHGWVDGSLDEKATAADEHWLPKELHRALKGGNRAHATRPDVCTYPTPEAADKALRQALVDLKWEKDQDGVWGPPKAAKVPVAPFKSASWWYFQTPNAVGASAFSAEEYKTRGIVPVEVMMKLHAAQKNSSYKSVYAYDGSMPLFVCYDTEAEAKAAYAAATATEAPKPEVKAEVKEEPKGPAPAHNRTKNYWYWATASYQWIEASDIVGAEACHISEELIRLMEDSRNARGGWYVEYTTEEKARAEYEMASAILALQKVSPAVRAYEPHKSSVDHYVWTTFTGRGLWKNQKAESTLPDAVWAALSSDSNDGFVDGTRGQGENALKVSGRWRSYKTRDQAMAALYAALEAAGDREPCPMDSFGETRYIWFTPDSKDSTVEKATPVVKALCRLPMDVVKALAAKTHEYYSRGFPGCDNSGWVMYTSRAAAIKAYKILMEERAKEARAKKEQEEKEAAAAAERAKAEAAKAVEAKTAAYAPAEYHGRWYWPCAGKVHDSVFNGFEFVGSLLPRELFDKLTGGDQRSTMSTNAWVRYVTAADALADLEKAKKGAEKVEEKNATGPEYLPLNHGAKWYWLHKEHTTTGWSKGFERAQLPFALFNYLTAPGGQVQRLSGSTFAEYPSKEAAETDLAQAKAKFEDAKATGKPIWRLPFDRATYVANEPILRASPEVTQYECVKVDAAKGEIVLKETTTRTIVVPPEWYVVMVSRKGRDDVVTKPCNTNGDPV